MIRVATLFLALGTLAACSSTPDPLNTSGRPDGTPGNPSGTAVSRANDRVGDPLNINNVPDGARGNPEGTAVSRSLGTTDRRVGRSARASNQRVVRRASNRPVARASAVRSSGSIDGARTPVDPRFPTTPGQQPSGQQGGSGSGS